MAVAHDAVSRNTALDTTTPPTGNFTWTHTPTGTPKGVAVSIVQTSGADTVTAVTYGGVTMARVRWDAATSAEPGSVYWYFLGSNIPTGAQTVSVTTSAALSRVGYCATVTAATTETRLDISNGVGFASTQTNPSLSLDYTDGLASWAAYYSIFSGLAAPVTTVEAGSTHVWGNDHGASASMFARKSGTAGNSTTMGYTAAIDDVSHGGVVIQEWDPGSFTVIQDWVFADNGGTATATQAVSLGSAATKGKTLLAFANSDATVATPSGWTQLASSVNNAGGYLFGKIADGGETGITVTPSVTASTCVGICELGGVLGSTIALQLDKTATGGSASAATTRSTGTTAATAQADEHAVAMWGYSADNAFIPGGGPNRWSGQTNSFVEKGDVGTTKGSGTNVGLCVGVRQLTATGTQESTATLTNSAPAQSIIATFKTNAAVSATNTAPGGIGSSEAWGDPDITLGTAPAGIESDETVGNSTGNLKGDLGSISSSEQAGNAALALAGIPGSASSSEVFGSPTITLTVSPGGIASSEASGATVISGAAPVNVAPGSIESAERFGTTTVTLTVSPGGMRSDEKFGVTSTTETVSPGSMAADGTVGTASATQTLTVNPGGIPSSETFGSPTAIQATQAAPGGISSSERFGSPTVTEGANPGGVDSSERFGTTTVTITVSPGGMISDSTMGSASTLVVSTTAPGGIGTAERFGSPSFTLQAPQGGIESSEKFGSPTVTLTVSPGGIPSSQAFGSPDVTSGTILQPGFIPSQEKFGNAVATVYVSPGGIPSSEVFGKLSLAETVSPGGIGSDEAFGKPFISIQTEVFLFPGSMGDSGRMGSAYLEPPARSSTHSASLKDVDGNATLYRTDIRSKLFRLILRARIKK